MVIETSPAPHDIPCRFWEIADITKLVEDSEKAPKARWPYKKREPDTLQTEEPAI
jgi:hypothetical protein